MRTLQENRCNHHTNNIHVEEKTVEVTILNEAQNESLEAKNNEYAHQNTIESLIRLI